jgi:hypothetical protein
MQSNHICKDCTLFGICCGGTIVQRFLSDLWFPKNAIGHESGTLRRDPPSTNKYPQRDKLMYQRALLSEGSYCLKEYGLHSEENPFCISPPVTPIDSGNLIIFINLISQSWNQWWNGWLAIWMTLESWITLTWDLNPWHRISDLPNLVVVKVMFHLGKERKCGPWGGFCFPLQVHLW